MYNSISLLNKPVTYFEIFNYRFIKCNDCNAINDLLWTCFQSNTYDHVNICKSVSSGDANLKKRANLPESTKTVAHTSSIERSNVIFDDVQIANDRSNLSNMMTESPNNLMKTKHTGNNDLSTFGLVKRGLRIANLNICHILNKVDEIKILFSEKRSVDILGICETFLNSEISDELITADGFNFERRDREGKSGGVY